MEEIARAEDLKIRSGYRARRNKFLGVSSTPSQRALFSILRQVPPGARERWGGGRDEREKKKRTKARGRRGSRERGSQPPVYPFLARALLYMLRCNSRI